MHLRVPFIGVVIVVFFAGLCSLEAQTSTEAVPLQLSTASTTVTEMPLVPHMPSIDGQGGTGLPTAQGQLALIGNPAGYSASKLTFTALSAGSWLTLRPRETSSTLWDLIAGGKFGLPGLVNNLSSEFSAQGLGAGASALIGLTGKGVGLGLSAVTEGYFCGSYPAKLLGEVQTELSVTAGFAIHLRVLGSDLSLGFDARPLVRIHAVLDNAASERVLAQIASGDVGIGVLNDVPTLNGYGLAMDTGLQLRRGALSFGLQFRDVGGTRLSYSAQSFETVLDYLGRAGLPPTTIDQVADVSRVSYVVPMGVATGIEFHPDLGSFSRFIDPRFFLDVLDLVPVFDGTTSIIDAARIGARVTLLSFLDLYAGIGTNYYSAGFGLKLLWLDLSVAAYEQTGTGASRDSGIAVHATLQF